MFNDLCDFKTKIVIANYLHQTKEILEHDEC